MNITAFSIFFCLGSPKFTYISKSINYFFILITVHHVTPKISLGCPRPTFDHFSDKRKTVRFSLQQTETRVDQVFRVWGLKTKKSQLCLAIADTHWQEDKHIGITVVV